MKRIKAYAHSRGRGAATVRFGVAAWLLAIGTYLCVRGNRFGALFLAPATLHIYLGYRALRDDTNDVVNRPG